MSAKKHTFHDLRGREFSVRFTLPSLLDFCDQHCCDIDTIFDKPAINAEGKAIMSLSLKRLFRLAWHACRSSHHFKVSGPGGAIPTEAEFYELLEDAEVFAAVTVAVVGALDDFFRRLKPAVTPPAVTATETADSSTSGPEHQNEAGPEAPSSS